MGLQPRSDLKQVVIDFDGPEYTAKTVWNVGAWNDISNDWMGKPYVLEDGMPSVDAEAMKRFNDAVGSTMAEVLRQNVSLRLQRDAAKAETDLNVSVQRDQQDHIAKMLNSLKAQDGTIRSLQQSADYWLAEFNKRSRWAPPPKRPLLYRLTMGFFGS